MYKIKYGKNKFGALISVLLFIAFFLAGGITALVAERTYFTDEGLKFEAFDPKDMTKTEVVDHIEDNEIQNDVSLPDNDMREVRIKGIEIGNYISEGDIIDVRIVGYDGSDEKLLAEKCITGIDADGISLIVKEEELPGITQAFIKMADGTVVKAYAVRIP